MINIVLCRDTSDLICLKLGMMLDMTNLYNLIPVGMTVMFTQGDGHRFTGKQELVQSFYYKVAVMYQGVGHWT